MAETSFYARALHEGERYGGDPYVFVRELAQNARDAGATNIVVTATVEAGVERVVFEDDGAGMSFAHARAYLFRLYASSKETSRDAAGHFGVGFWSILRYRAEELRIDSRTDAEAWAVVLDGKLANLQRAEPALNHRGTRITLVRPAATRARHDAHDAAPVAEEVRRALHHYCRYLRRRTADSLPLPISLNGRRVDEPLELDAPMRITFHARGSEGAIGFGDVPRVELWARGLWVQSVTALEELEPESGARRARSAPQGLAPVMVLNSNELDVVMSRSSPVANRALRRLLRTARERLDRLVAHACEGAVPRNWRERAWDATADALRGVGGRMGLVVYAVWGVAMSLALAGAMRWSSGSSPPMEVAGPGLETALAVPAPAAAGGATAGAPPVDAASSKARPTAAEIPSPPAPRPAVDAELELPAVPIAPIDGYSGAVVDSPDSAPPPWRVEVSSERALFFKLLTLDRFDPWRGMVASSVGARRPATPWTCLVDCVEVTAELEAGARGAVIPVPTGYALETSSLVALGRPVGSLGVDPGGAVWLDWPPGATGRIKYRVGPRAAGAERPELSTVQRWSPALAELVERVRRLSPDERVAAVLSAAAESVRYDTSSRAAGLHARARGPWVDRVLAHGVGDCDVINGLAVSLLRAVDLPAQLAVGFVAEGGTTNAGLHAWVEVDTGRGWVAADATERVPGGDARATATASPLEVGPAVVARTRGAGPPPREHGALARRLGAVAAGLVGLVAATLLVVFWRARVRERLVTPAQRDEQRRALARIATDALQHPEAWQRAATLWNRPMLPTLSGRGLSLSQARARQARGALFSSAKRSALALEAARRNPVLDAADPVFGELIATALRPIDLDGIDAMGVLETHGDQGTAFIRRARPWLRDAHCTLVESASIGAAALLDVDLSALRLPHGSSGPRRFVVVNVQHGELRRRVALAERGGLRGLAEWIDWLCEHSALVGARAGAVRRRLAVAVLDEAARDDAGLDEAAS